MTGLEPYVDIDGREFPEVYFPSQDIFDALREDYMTEPIKRTLLTIWLKRVRIWVNSQPNMDQVRDKGKIIEYVETIRPDFD